MDVVGYAVGQGPQFPGTLRLRWWAGLAYGANYERLVALKRTYDPDDVFRLNPNIPPTG